jgi:hypothetical protein
MNESYLDTDTYVLVSYKGQTVALNDPSRKQ